MYLNDCIYMEKLCASLSFAPESMYQDNELNTFLCYTLCLEQNCQQLLSTGQYSISELLYGKYTWFTRFLVRYEALYGLNAGMRQKQFKIIEEMDYAGVVDSTQLEYIEKQLGLQAEKDSTTMGEQHGKYD